MNGVVVPTNSKGSIPAKVEKSSPSSLLQRYLQLNTVLPEATSLPDGAVEALVLKVEETTVPKFDERLISGEWQLVWQRNTKQATTSQKALAPLPQFSNFIKNEGAHTAFFQPCSSCRCISS